MPQLSVRVIRGYLLLLLTAGCWGCSGPSGTFTLFPAGDFLLDSTKDLEKRVPAQMVVPRELEKTVIPAYVVQPGDVLLVEPVQLDSPLRFPADQTVLPDGSIDLGRFGRLVVAGKTLEQIESDVDAAIKALEKDAGAINVRLINPQSAVYYVLGEVSSPGSFPYVGRETVLDAILSAGGLTDKASQCNIILSRPSAPGGCRTVIPICYRHIVQQGDTASNYQLMPGDRVYVATRTLWEQLSPCYNRRDCPQCRGQQCPCPAGCGAAAAPLTSYSLPSLPVLAPPISDTIEMVPPGTSSEVILEEPSPPIARQVKGDPFQDPFGDDE